MTTSWQGALLDNTRSDGICNGVIPFGLNVGDRRIHADAVDFPVGGQRADDDRHGIFAALGIDDVVEQERLAILFLHAANELPAHQRMQFAVLVDLAVIPLQIDPRRSSSARCCCRSR